MDSSKGFSRQAHEIEHLKCMALWKEKESRSTAGTEVSTLVNSRQLDRNCKYFSAIVDIIVFLVSNTLPLRGSLDALIIYESGRNNGESSLLRCKERVYVRVCQGETFPATVRWPQRPSRDPGLLS